MTKTKVNGHNLQNAHLIRFCRTWQTNRAGLPSFSAFMFRQGECSLSFNWLEKACIDAGVCIDFDEAILELEKEPQLEPEDGFIWAMLKYEIIKSVVENATDKLPEIGLDSKTKNPSHVLVWGWKKRSKQIRKDIATALANKVPLQNTRPWPQTPRSTLDSTRGFNPYG